MSRYGEPLRRERDERIQADVDPSRPLSADDIVAALDGMATLIESHPRFEVATQYGCKFGGDVCWESIGSIGRTLAAQRVGAIITEQGDASLVKRTVYIGPTEDVDA